MKLFLLALVLLFGTSTTNAMFGETYDQCVARYGPPRVKPKPGEPTFFYKETFLIMIVFENGRAANVNLQRAATDSPNHSKPIAEDEIELWLKTNSRGVQWHEEKPTKQVRAWKTKDGKMVAFYNKASNVLNIQSAK